jgi:hypothetical protein
MSSPKVPNPQTAIKSVAPIVPEIYRAFENGTMKSKEYFQTEKLGLDGHLEAMLVRIHAREHLKKHPDFSSVTFDKLAMCGISFRFKKWQFRLWKSADRRSAKIPKPGNSTKRQKYFVQPQQLDLFAHKKHVAGPKLHLIILWNLDTHGNLEKLWLVCPENFDARTGEIMVHWVAELPNPITGTQASGASVPVPDLLIKLKEIKKEKEA